jgi:hypothetical protein
MSAERRRPLPGLRWREFVLLAGRAEDLASTAFPVSSSQPLEVRVGHGEGPGDVVVPDDPARAGESARMVLSRLVAMGWFGEADEYTDDDEALLSGRLRNFGYR